MWTKNKAYCSLTTSVALLLAVLVIFKQCYAHTNTRTGRSEAGFKTSARTSEELLNDIVTFGLEQSRHLHEVKEKEIYESGITLKKSDPAHFVAVFNKQTPRAKELSRYGYATLEASRLLTRQFMLTRQQVVYGLERVELRSTDLFDECPFRSASIPGFPERKRQFTGGVRDPDGDGYCVGLDMLYRSADGSCNNMKHPEWGASLTPFLRFLPPDYSDGVQAFRKAKSGDELPNPRLISTTVHQESRDETVQFTMMVMQWGQFLDHDLTSTPQTRGFNHSLIRCCTEGSQMFLNRNLLHPDCMPIRVENSDYFYSRHNATCMEFVRSSPAPRKDCSLGPRDQINQLTSYMDASNVYGSTKEDQDELRLGKSGKLKYTNLHIRKPLLPALDPNTAEEECRISTRNLHCFAAGDRRCNEQPGLTAIHTVFLREHNRIAKKLSIVNRHWNDDRLFYETRKIVGALLQHITYNEWLPIVLGPRVLDIFELKLLPKNYYNGYNDTINPTIANSFASAAFRFGHSLVKSTLRRCNKNFSEVPFFIKLHKELNNPSNLHNFGSVDRLMFGLVDQKISRRDEFISSELTNNLFQHRDSGFGMDLAALNIQRGRDHGLAAYNIWREQCGLRRFQEWDDLKAVMSSTTVDRLASVYQSVEDVDLFTGGLSERPVVGGMVGPTFACILGQQFLNLRRGDRFWYENGADINPGGFTNVQLREVRKASLSRIICDNLDDVTMIQPYAFLANDDFTNRRRSCRGNAIPSINLKLWAETPQKPSQFSSAADTLFTLYTKDQAVAVDPSASDLFNHLRPQTTSPPITAPVDDPDVLDAWLKGKNKAESTASASSRPYVTETPKPIDNQGRMADLGAGWLDNILEESLGDEHARSLANKEFDNFIFELDRSYSENVKASG